jgi:hypothetical protein
MVERYAPAVLVLIGAMPACRAARQRMVERYAPAVVAEQLQCHLAGVHERLMGAGDGESAAAHGEEL